MLTSSDTGETQRGRERKREQGERERREERASEREKRERDITLRDTKTLSNGLVSQDITFYAGATQSLKWRENESMGKASLVCMCVGRDGREERGWEKRGRFVYVL